MRKCLAAMTSTGGAFPPYINASVDEDGDVAISFRDDHGALSHATFKLKEWAQFRRQVIENV